MVKTEGPPELKPIEQLAKRVQSLIEVLGTTREELTLALDENTRLSGEVEELRGKLQTAEEEQQTQIRERQSEQDEIRDHVTQLLAQLEAINPS